jgi:sulfate-transporting ATPase
LARSFQTVEPFNDLNVAENIAVGFERVRWFDWLRTLARPTSATLDQELRAEASSLELDLDRFPDSLSQGRRRALGVLRALATRPAVLLLDEPAAGLDKDETKHLGTVLRRVAKERGIGLLLVEHDMTLVSAVCDKVVLIDFGKTLFSGPMADAFDSPIVRAAYLGEAVSAEHEQGVVVTGDLRQ